MRRSSQPCHLFLKLRLSLPLWHLQCHPLSTNDETPQRLHHRVEGISWGRPSLHHYLAHMDRRRSQLSRDGTGSGKKEKRLSEDHELLRRRTRDEDNRVGVDRYLLYRQIQLC